MSSVIGQRRCNLNDPNEDSLRAWFAEDVVVRSDEFGIGTMVDVYAKLVYDQDCPKRVGEHRVFSLDEWSDMLLVREDRDPAELVASGFYE